ncbi:MAG: hypothetical protein ACQERM_11645 [Methanobacteriota archaeon]
MNRRTLLAGLGSTAAASAAVGTGAFSAAQISGRETDISVVNDAQGLVGLVPNPEISGVELVDGELAIALDDHGVNVNSVYQFGHFSEEWTTDPPTQKPDENIFPITTADPTASVDGNFRSAFLVRNQTDNAKDVEMTFSVDEGASSPGGTLFLFEAHYDDGSTVQTDEIAYDNGSGSTVSMSIQGLGAGEDLGVSFLVDATDGAVGDGLAASLSVSAGAAATGGGGGT